MSAGVRGGQVIKASANAVGALVRAMRDALAASDQAEGADEGKPAAPADAEDNDDE